jgi:predicted nucleotidyltransferase
MTTPKLHPDLSEFLCCLARHKVRFVVIGGHVLATLGRPRYTDDLDVLVEPTPTNARRLAEAFAAFGYPELATQARGHFLEPERMATLGRPPVAIDVLTSTPGISFKEAWAGRQVVKIEGHAIGFLGLVEFIKTKRACGRTKDLLDIELLREIGLVPASKRSRSATRTVAKRKPKQQR